MRSGRLHRYNTLAGEASETDLLEQEFAGWMGSRYCLACTSGGFALQIALRSVGVRPGDKVLCNGFTLAPVPGAIYSTGAETILVETTEDCVIDLQDLAAKAQASKARYLLLSHTRGHAVNMASLMKICKQFDLCLIEDCVHTMGARWKERRSGSFGTVSCFSTQTYKHLNSGEGGLLVTDDDSVMAKAVVHSGSYVLFDRHLAAPPPAAYDEIRYTMPNCSGRMDNLRAAILRPQLADLEQQCERWNERYAVLEQGLRMLSGVRLPQRAAEEGFIGSSIQFALPGWSEEKIELFVVGCGDRGVELKWFGADEPQGYTSRYDSWRYLGSPQPLPRTKKVLATLLDMRVPLTFDLDDCRLITTLIGEVLEEAAV